MARWRESSAAGQHRAERDGVALCGAVVDPYETPCSPVTADTAPARGEGLNDSQMQNPRRIVFSAGLSASILSFGLFLFLLVVGARACRIRCVLRHHDHVDG